MFLYIVLFPQWAKLPLQSLRSWAKIPSYCDQRLFHIPYLLVFHYALDLFFLPRAVLIAKGCWNRLLLQAMPGVGPGLLVTLVALVDWARGTWKAYAAIRSSR